MYPDQNNSNCGCTDSTTPTVTAPAPPDCIGGEQCVEIVNTSCVKYDGTDIPGVAANGDNMTSVLQGLANNGNIGGGGGAANFVLSPVGSNITLNGDTNPVTVDTAGQVVYIEGLSTPGPQGPPGATLSAKGTAASYAAMVAAHPSPTVLDAYVVQDTGHFWIYDPTSGAANGDGWVDMGAIAGPTGATGATGAAGPAGTSMLYGGSNPSSGVGNNGDFYINTLTNTLWGPKVGGAWPVSGVSLIGANGAPGTPGTPATVTVGTTTTGASGTSAAVSNAGTSSAAILNFTIPQGPAGAAGSPGAPGAPGTSILHGTTAPTGGNNGDFFLNTSTYVLYGPKAAGTWPSTGQSLIGASGSPGAPGAPGGTGPAGADGGAKILGFVNVTPSSNNTIASTMTTKMLLVNTTSGNVTVNVPNLDNTAFPVGMQVIVSWDVWDGDPPATYVNFLAGSLSTIKSANGMLKLRTRYSTATLIKQSYDATLGTVWYLAGDLMP